MKVSSLIKKGTIRLTDRELWRLFHSGNELAFFEIADRYSKYVFNEGWDFASEIIGFRLEAVNAAHDIMLLTFEKLYEQRSMFKKNSNLPVVLMLLLDQSKAETLYLIRKSESRRKGKRKEE
jgi:hypothetical protein